MSTTPLPNVPNASQDAKKESGETFPVPETLTDFLMLGNCPTRRYLQASSKRPNFNGEDLARARALVDSHPHQLARVVDLARAASDFVPQPGQLLRWCEDIVRSRHHALRDWGLNPSQDAPTVFRELLAWAAPNLTKKAKKEQRHLAESTVLIGLCTLIARRALAPMEALRSIAEVKHRATNKTTVATKELATTRQITHGNFKQLFEYSLIADLLENNIRVAAEAKNSALVQSDGLRRQNLVLEKKIESLTGELASLKEELNSRNRHNENLAATLEGTQTHAIQDLRRLRARFLRLIGERLSGLLNDAWDALDTTPPHPDVALERIVSARDLIQKEIEWLRQSSD